jgi:hypothetical protein
VLAAVIVFVGLIVIQTVLVLPVVGASAGWRTEPISAPPGASGGQLNGLSCPSSEDCIAVGLDYQAAPPADIALAEQWTGASWSAQSVPTRPGLNLDDELSAVSCVSVVFCVAVGSAENSVHVSYPLVELWNGTTWHLATIPALPSDDVDIYLAGVSCHGLDDCTAVGWVLHQTAPVGPGTNVPLEAHWNGAGWTIEVLSPTTSSPYGELDAVSCPAVDLCIAVGNTSGAPLLETWNGTRWSAEPFAVTAVAGDVGYVAVSCPATKACNAVGVGNGTTASASVVAGANGTWSVRPVPSPVAAKLGYLSDVTCSAVGSCTAVGWLSKEEPCTTRPAGPTGPVFCGGAQFMDVFTTFAEGWNGSRWLIEPTPSVAGTTRNFLRAVSCTAANACIAVGNSGEATMLVEQQ